MDRLLRLLLRPDEQHDAVASGEVAGEGVGLLEPLQALLEVDDVDAGAFPVQEPLHLRVPASGLVPEVDSCLEELPPCDDGHGASLFGFVLPSARFLPSRPGVAAGTPGPVPEPVMYAEAPHGSLAAATWPSPSVAVRSLPVRRRRISVEPEARVARAARVPRTGSGSSRWRGTPGGSR